MTAMELASSGNGKSDGVVKSRSTIAEENFSNVLLRVRVLRSES